VALSYETLSTGTTPASFGSGAVTVLPVPGAHTYGNSLPTLGTAIGSTSYEFYDDYVFTITSATANILTATINLGSSLALANVQSRLFAYADTLTSPFPWLGALSPAPLDAWSVPSSNPNVDLLVIDPISLAAGTYVLQVRGNVDGVFGGAYSGVINLAPVPLPPALLLLASGLTGLFALRRSARKI
jgi:hypothetical protein